MFPELNLIKRKRMLLELTQKDLSTLSGISQSMIAKIESNKIEPSYSTVKKLFLALKNVEEKEKRTCEQIMNKKIHFIREDRFVKDSIKIMHKYSISQLPVKKGEAIVGVIGENTILDKLSSGISSEELSNLKVKESMGNPLPTINKDSSVENILPLVKEIGSVLILDKNKPVGIITKSDLI